MQTHNRTIFVIIAMIVAALLGIFAMQQLPSTGNSATSTPSEGKLNIHAICEAALVYMTFPDDVSAQKFISECQEGKHPEVIEKYKADMHIQNDAAI
jgi:hypothetical protein